MFADDFEPAAVVAAGGGGLLTFEGFLADVVAVEPAATASTAKSIEPMPCGS